MEHFVFRSSYLLYCIQQINLHLLNVICIFYTLIYLRLYLYCFIIDIINLKYTNEYIRGKMDAQDTILNEITRKQLIWYGHVERMDPTRLPKIMIYWKPEGRKKRGRPRRTWKDGIFTAINERDLRMVNGTTEGDGIWQPEGVVRRFNTARARTRTHTHTVYCLKE